MLLKALDFFMEISYSLLYFDGGQGEAFTAKRAMDKGNVATDPEGCFYQKIQPKLILFIANQVFYRARAVKIEIDDFYRNLQKTYYN